MNVLRFTRLAACLLLGLPAGLMAQTEIYVGNRGDVFDVALSPDDASLFTGSDQRFCWMWDIATGGQVRLFSEQRASNVTAVAVSPNGEWLATGDSGGRAYVYEIDSGDLLRVFESGNAGTVSDVAFSPDSASILTASSVSQVILWDRSTGTKVRSFLHPASVNGIAFSPDGTRFVSGCHDYVVRIWSTDDDTAPIRALSQHTDPVLAVAFAHDGTRVASAGGDDAIVWDVSSGAVVSTCTGHSAAVNAVAFLPGDAQVVTGSSDGSARLWNAASGAEIRSYNGHDQTITSLAVTSDGATLLTGSRDDSVRLWEVNSGAEIRTIAGHLASLRGAAVSADGRFVATASVDDTAKIWNRFTGTLARSLEGHTGNVNTVQLNATGTLCVTGAEDQQAIVWDATTGTILRTFTTHTGAINAVALSTDGELAVTGSDDDTAKLWNVTTGAELHTYSEPGMTDVRAVAISPDRTKVLTGGQDNSVRLWDLYGVTSTWSSGSLGNDVRAVAFSPDGVLVAAAASTDVTVWRVATGAVVHTLSGHSSNVVSVMFSPDGDHLLTGGFDDRAVVWNLDTGTQAFAAHPLADVYSAVYTPEGKQMVLALGAERAELWEIPLQSYTEHAGAITALDFLPSGAQFVSGSTDDTAKLWNTEEATVARTYDEHTSDVLSLDVAPDGSTVATGSMDRDAIVRQTATGVLVQTYDDHNERVQAIAFNPVNAGIVATGSWDNSVRTWDVATTTVAFDLDLGRNPLGLAFSPNGTHLAIACQSAVPTANAVIYDVATQALTGTLAGHSARVNCIAWSPDGRFLCTGSSDDQFIAAIWDAQTGNLLHALVGHDAAVNAVAFSPDSSLVATGSNDNLAKLWDVVTGSDLRTFRGHGNENVTAVAFSPGGKQVLTGGTGGVIRLWRISISDLRVTQPDTALTWEEGTVQEVTWETGDIQANVDLTYSLDQGVTWQPIVLNTPNDGSELWTLPLVDADVNTCLVSVQSTTSAADYDASDALFTIQDTGGAPPTKAITVVSPNGGEVWAELSTHYILWETQGDVGQVSVHLSVNGGQTWTPVDPLVTSANDGKNWYAWDIPDLAEDKPECLIRIQNVTGENVADESDAVFTISTGAPPDATPHDADYDGNWIIEPHEVTRVIELYKAGHYHRDNSPQPHADGFAPGEAP